MSTAVAAPPARPRGAIQTYLQQTRDPGMGLLLSLPLLLIYNLGLWFGDLGIMNGADFITGATYRAFGPRGFLLFQAALLVIGVGTVIILKRHGRLNPRHFIVLLAESLVYALVMGTFIVHLMQKTHLLGPGGDHGIFGSIVLSAGAGFHEELVFRMLLLGGLLLLLRRLFDWPPWLAATVAVLVSSVLFSVAHYFGTESFAWYTFWYRSLAGIYFAVLYVARGFAVAAYTHALYDIYVMVF